MITFQNPWRPNYEIHMASAWGLAFVTSLSAPIYLSATSLPLYPFLAVALLTWAMLCLRAMQAWNLHRLKLRLGPRPIWEMPPAEAVSTFQNALAAKAIWLGSGFKWDQRHTQRAFDLGSEAAVEVIPDSDTMGSSWIHGIADEDEEGDVSLPIANMAGHLLIVGTTGAGKTRLMELLVCQAVLRGEPVVIIDPKGDRGLLEVARKACILAGEPDRFIYFHPAFPETSCRINPLHNYNRPTEIASRIASMLPSGGDSQTFTAFSQMAVNNIVQGLLLTGQRPTLVNIRSYLEGGTSGIVVQTLEAYFDQNMPKWRSEPGVKARQDTVEAKATVMDKFYWEKVKPFAPSPDVEGLLKMNSHSKEHFQKMITSLLPKLNMLTSGDMGPLLSPSAADVDDERTITDMARIIRARQVAFIGLDSLSDTSVGQAIGSILLADLTAVAGNRYNYNTDPRPVNLFVDEAAEVINDPFIQMLNKSRGAGFRIVAATQTYADFAMKMGSEAAAKVILGNLNNVIALRTIDTATQEQITEALPTVQVRTMIRGLSSSIGENPLELTRNSTQMLKGQEVPMFAPHLLGQLPNGEFIGVLSGGKLFKGRVPLLLDPPEPQPVPEMAA